MDKNKAIVVFQGNKVRRVWYNNEWWFVIKDIISVLTESVNPSDYLKKLRKRDEFLSGAFKGGGQIVPPLGLEFNTAGGRQMLQCWNIRGIFRLIQSIPSKKAEPFKRWLAQVGHERIQEIENPELAQKRMKEIYKAKGYPDKWIEKRVRGIAIRDELTDEWDKRGIKSQDGFAILTAEISKATFGMTPGEYKDLTNENLRDHMDDIELILTMLGEATTTRFTRERDSQKFKQLKKDAKDGGGVAGSARKEIERHLGKPVILKNNFLNMLSIKKKRKKKLS